ncbi:hypothetical protein AU210_000360 [Fusarium oxysporum f. sp. radicis-cucumerinum]|uniref:Protein kinase domain-containing protein n=1 Tax=Fusarium oxysporum f. sp. radicis-cucumerinum TaxID=327505 RepID=A0A2H3HRI5_FUSOX|nr:hypothetical protein AU210_000360 [Fusarium oxysporum f. sp. radicis-cucumerinum]
MSITAWTDEDVRASLVPQKEFPTCSYRRGTRLGRGAYANVYKVLNVKTGGLFAGKVSPEYADHLRKEARNLTRLNHSQIVKFIDYCEDKHNPAASVLVMELCAGGSLQDKIHDNPAGLKGKDTLQVMLQVGQAVEYLHGKGLFHGDIKPRNIIIRSWSPVDVVVGDCAEVMKVEHIDRHKRPHGTRSYWSPYIEKYWRHSGKSDDIWALGISLLGMMAQWPCYLVKQEKLYQRKRDSSQWENWTLSSLLMLRSILTPSRPSQSVLQTTLRSNIPLHLSRSFSSSVSVMSNQTQKLKPAARVQGQKKDVWSMINEAAASSPIQPIVNLGQGFFGYNPPDFILNAAKEALDRVECNQYAPAKGRPRLRKALADAYSPLWGRQLDPESEIIITTGANEGMLSAFMGFIEPGDEVIVFEPFFDQYISNIQMPGGKVVYVPLHPPETGATKNSSAADWTIDFDELEKAFTPRTKMIVINTPHNPVGKVFHKDELQKIADLAVKHQTIILSDEVYDRLFYVPFTRIANLSPEVEKLTLTVGSAGKNFYATGWRVGWLIGPPELIQPVTAAHTRICFSTPAPFQEAAAIGFEQADKNGFWDETIKEMKAKVDRLNEVFEELNLPVTYPEGGYFLLVNMAKVKLPEDYPFPPHVASRPRDFKLAWFLIQEIGVAAIPPTEFYTPNNAHLAEDYIRFAVCKNDDILEQAKERLRGLKKYIQE